MDDGWLFDPMTQSFYFPQCNATSSVILLERLRTPAVDVVRSISRKGPMVRRRSRRLIAGAKPLHVASKKLLGQAQSLFPLD
jgi:hypothetical protein